MNLDHDSEGAVVTYRCGTRVIINANDTTTFDQSTPCTKAELAILRDLNDIGLRSALHDARDQISLLESEVASDEALIAELRDEIAVLQGGGTDVPKAVRMDVSFGKAKAKG